MAHYKDGYEDIMDERRRTHDLKYITRTRHNVPMYKYCHVRSPEQIKCDVLQSQRVRYALEEVCFLTPKGANAVLGMWGWVEIFL